MRIPFPPSRRGDSGRSGRRSRPAVLLAVASILASILLEASVPVATLGASPAALPSSIASVGDSITRAFNAGSTAYADYTAGSWATGTDARVASIYARILAQNSGISGRNPNHAKSGARVADLGGQLAVVATRNVDAVTIVIGGNDVCTSSESTMTTVDAFRTSFRTAFDDFTTASPATSLYVASIPSVELLWSLFKGSSTARSVWSLFRICQSMLANPTSTKSADVERRKRVIQREKDFNAILRSTCEAYVRCRSDADAVFGTSFTTGDISPRDYFHPSLAGQKRLAAVTWTAWGLGTP
jgi:lysophospholipase L1-like esterase